MSRKKTIDRNARFQPIRGAAEITGLSTKYIKEGCIKGTVPHMKIGADYRVDMLQYMEQLTNATKGGRT